MQWSEITHFPISHVVAHDLEEQSNSKASVRFLVAWKAAVLVLGSPLLFHCKTLEEVKVASDREDIRPDYTAFLHFMESAPYSDRVYAASLYSFYNPSVAERWLERCGLHSPGMLGLHLSPAQISALSELMRWHYEW